MRGGVVLLMLFAALQAGAQDLPPQVQQRLEEAAEQLELEQVDDDGMLQEAEFYRRKPLNLNAAGIEDLQRLGLSQHQVSQFLAYRRLAGPLVHIYELQAVPGWDFITIRRILPYIKIEDVNGPLPGIRKAIQEGAWEGLIRTGRTLESAEGFKNTNGKGYLGDPFNMLVRIRFQSSTFLKFGLTLEKDAGERFSFSNSQKGFDFLSFHLYVKPGRLIKEMAAGDYQLNLGQGLIHWQSLAFGKGAAVLNHKREAPVIVPYRSAGEFHFLRGAATSFNKGRFTLIPFFSSRRISGNTDSSEENFSSFNTSGFHRTANELADRNSINKTLYGSSLQYRSGSFNSGINYIQYRFSHSLRKRSAPYNLFAPAGDRFRFISLDYSLTLGNLHLFGEAGIGDNAGFGITGGGLLTLHAKADMGFHYRKTTNTFRPFAANHFAESSTASEEGYYLGLILRPVKGLSIHAFADLFIFPWLRYRVDAPSSGTEQMFYLEYQPNKQAEFNFQYRHRATSLNEKEEPMNFPSDRSRHHLRMSFSKTIGPIISLRSRVDWVKLNAAHSQEGYSSFIDLIIKKQPIQLHLRLQWFDTDGYDSRIYTIENSVLYHSPLNMVYGRGLRHYYVLRFKSSQAWNIQFRYSQLVLRDVQSTGSGLNRIQGNTKSDVLVQFNFFFQ